MLRALGPQDAIWRSSVMPSSTTLATRVAKNSHIGRIGALCTETNL